MVICDIDGVLADYSHRVRFIEGLNKDWPAFFDAMVEDKRIQKGIDLVCDLCVLHDIVYITGRPESHREQTITWFLENGVPWMRAGQHLFMRATGDHREDYIVKRELWLGRVEKIWPRDKVRAVIEDRNQVVEMWRELGLHCLQPKDGDF